MNNDNRLMIIDVPHQVILNLLGGPRLECEFMVITRLAGLPDDAVVISAFENPASMSISFVVRSSSFSERADGCHIPRICASTWETKTVQFRTEPKLHPEALKLLQSAGDHWRYNQAQWRSLVLHGETQGYYQWLSDHLNSDDFDSFG